LNTPDSTAGALTRPVLLLLCLLTLHTALLVASNAAGGKMIALPLGLSASATVFSYMGTFVMIDVLAELYGRRVATLTINLGLLGVVLSVAFFQLAILSPPAPVWTHQSEFATTLGASWRILLAGWAAYLVSQNIDVWSFTTMKNSRALGRLGLGARALASTLVGQLLDTAIFIGVAFYGEFPIGKAILGQYLIKLVLAVVSVPLVYLGVALGRRALVHDHKKAAPT